MGILLGFTPFIAFALLTSLSVSLAIWIAFAIAFALAIRDFASTKTIRVLDGGGLLLFGALALVAGFIAPSLSMQGARFIIDAGLLAVALGSLVMRNPITLQYARDQVAPEFWDDRRFVRANYGVTAVWTLAFATMATADAIATFTKHLPPSLDIAAGLGALAVAILVTVRYPNFARTGLCAAKQK
ncbi:MAG TPA: hypothetical protein VGG36_04305 [Rhizomicrobium sp.]|jgi:hypothetical protein